MKILHVCLANYYADHHTYQENLLPAAHKKMGYEVEILASTESFNENNEIDYTAASQYFTEDRIKITRLPYVGCVPFYLRKKFRIYRGIKSEFIRIDPDIVFIHDVQFLSVFLIVNLIKKRRKEKPIKVIADCHADFSNSARNFISYHILHKMIYKRCALKLNEVTEKFWGVLPTRVDFLQQVYGIPKAKTGLLRLGVSEAWAAKARDPALAGMYRSEYGYSDSEIVIATGGRIDKFKRQTIDLMHEFKNHSPLESKLVIFGSISSDLKRDFLDLVRSERRITYVGFLSASELIKILLLSDIGVFMGRHSVVWEQAVGVGLPLILKDKNIVAHLNHNSNALYASSPLKAIERINSLIEYNQLYDLKRKAQADTRLKFSYEKIAEQSLCI